jgi:molybdopterin converting factor small subunit
MFFGELAEITGENKISFRYFEHLFELKNAVLETYPKLKNKSFQLAVNNCISNENNLLKKEDKVVFLPPFAGG